MGLFLHKFAIGDESLDIRHFSFSKLFNCCSQLCSKTRKGKTPARMPNLCIHTK